MAFPALWECKTMNAKNWRETVAKGVVVAADRGGKTKTLTQLISIGFLLATPMVAWDWSYFTDTDLSGLTELTHRIGLVGFIAGTFLAIWSGWRYIRQYKDVVFSDTDQ